MSTKRKPRPKRSEVVSVRLDEPTREKLERSIKENGKKLSGEIADRIIASFSNEAALQRTIELGKILSSRLSRSELELEDIVLFLQFAEFVQEAVAQAGEEKGAWHRYARHAHFPDVLSETAVAVRDRLKIAQSVERDYQTSRAFIASRGAPPADDVARRAAIGMGGVHTYEKIAEHKWHARRVARIEANRSSGAARLAHEQPTIGEGRTE